MAENLKQDSLYKPLKSASAIANTQSAVQIGSTCHKDNSKEANRSSDGTDTRHLRKSTDHAGWPGRLGRYSRDDLGLDNLSRLEDELSRCRLDGWKEGLPHGPLCKCRYSAHPVDQFQDVAGVRRPVTDKLSSFTCRSDDYRDCYADWNPVEPFPQVQFESGGVPFVYDGPVLRKTNVENDQSRRSCDALVSAISMKLETQSKIIEKLHNGLKRLEDERDTYTQLFRELRDEMISLNGQIIETQTNASLNREFGVWKHQIETEMHHLEANVNRFHNQGKDVSAENSHRIADLRHEFSEMKKFLSDDVEATRRETRKLHSRIGQLEVDMVGTLSENKDLYRKLQKLEKGVHSVVQSQTFLSRDLCKTQSQQTKDTTDLKQLQRSYRCLSQKLNELTLKTCGAGNHGILRNVPTASVEIIDLKQKTGRKSRSRRVKKKSPDDDDLGLNVMSESSSLTSLTDTMSANNDQLAESRRGKESSVNVTPKKTKAKKKKSKSIAKKGGSSESFSPLPDMDTSDSLTETKVKPVAIEADQVAGAAKNHPVEREPSSGPSSGNVEASASHSITITTTSSSSSSSSSTSSSSSSSSSSLSPSSSSASCSDLIS